MSIEQLGFLACHPNSAYEHLFMLWSMRTHNTHSRCRAFGSETGTTFFYAFSNRWSNPDLSQARQTLYLLSYPSINILLNKNIFTLRFSVHVSGDFTKLKIKRILWNHSNRGAQCSWVGPILLVRGYVISWVCYAISPGKITLGKSFLSFILLCYKIELSFV